MTEDNDNGNNGFFQDIDLEEIIEDIGGKLFFVKWKGRDFERWETREKQVNHNAKTSDSDLKKEKEERKNAKQENDEDGDVEIHDDALKEYAKNGLLPRIESTQNNYPLFNQFTSIAYQRIVNNTEISEMTMKETLEFAFKCLKGNAMIWCLKEDDIEMKDEQCDSTLNWLQSTDEANLFRNDSQSKYIQHLMERNDTDFLNGLDKYMHLLLYSIQQFPISQSKMHTLHSIAFQHLLHLICICYPSFARYKWLHIKFIALLLNETHLNLFYQRLLN
eukprot:972903_1